MADKNYIQSQSNQRYIEKFGQKLPGASTSQIGLTDKNLRSKHLPRGSQFMRSMDFLQKIKDKSKQKHIIKAINIINNTNSKPLIDQPQIANFIIEAMKKYNKQNINLFNNPSLLNSTKSTPRNSYKQSTFHQHKTYRLDSERRGIQKLNSWIQQKIKNQKIQQKNSGSLITQRLYTLQLAFTEACKYAGKYSQEIAETFTTIHTQYHQMYNKLVDCLMKQNINMKNKIRQLQQKINTIVIQYQKQLLDIRQQFDKKSTKVIENFHKCINMRNQLEQSNKKLVKQVKNQRIKLSFMQQALAKSLNILIQIGQEKFKFLTNEQEKILLSLGSNYTKYPTNYKLFHKWCSSLLKIIANMKENLKPQKREKQQTQSVQNQNMKYLKKFTLSAIGKFMIDFDPSLSIKDTEEILLNFISYQHEININNNSKNETNVDGNEEIKSKYKTNDGGKSKKSVHFNSNSNDNTINILQYHEKLLKLQQKYEQNENNLELAKYKEQQKNRKRAFNPSVPNLQEISEKFKGINVQVQVNFIKQCQNLGVQTFVETVECSITAKPREKTKQTSTLIWMREKMKITDIFDMNMYVWAQRDAKQVENIKRSKNIAIIEVEEQENKPKRKERKSLKQTITRKMSVLNSISALSGGNKRRQTKTGQNIPIFRQNNILKQSTKSKNSNNLLQSKNQKEKTITEQSESSPQTPNNKQQQPQLTPQKIKKSKGRKKSQMVRNKRVMFANQKQEVFVESTINIPINQEEQEDNNLKSSLICENEKKQEVQNQQNKKDISNSQKKESLSIKKIESIKNISITFQQNKDNTEYIHKQRKTNRSITIALEDQQSADLESGLLRSDHISTEKQISKLSSKSVGYLRNSNQSNNTYLQQMKRKGLIPQNIDGDMQAYLQEILARRKAQRQKTISREKQKQNEENLGGTCWKSRKKFQQKVKLDIYGRQISINKVQLKNLKPQSSKNIPINDLQLFHSNSHNNEQKQNILSQLIKFSQIKATKNMCHFQHNCTTE